MKRLVSMISALLLVFSLAPPVLAEHENACALTFGAFEGVRTIWAEYTSDALEGSLRVAFREVDGQTIANYKDGILYVAVVSRTPLDLTEPVAWVTQDGSDTPPALTLTALRFNEKPAPIHFSAQLRNVERIIGSLAIGVDVYTPTPMRCCMVAVAYRDGRMVAVDLQEIELKEVKTSVQAIINGCREADEVKVFFLTESYAPVGAVLYAQVQ